MVVPLQASFSEEGLPDLGGIRHRRAVAQPLDVQSSACVSIGWEKRGGVGAFSKMEANPA